MGKDEPSPDERLRPIARAQHGPFTRRQALGAGFSRHMIAGRVESGRWLDPHRGVYCDVGVPASLKRDASAAVLACGTGAAASYRTAGLLWKLDVPAPARPEVTVRSRARPPGVLVHATSRLSRSEAAARDGIRVTAPMRTLLDLAEVLEPKLLELSLDRMLRRGFVHPERLLAYLKDPWSRARRGSAVLRKLVHERLGQGPSGSDVETLLLQLIRGAGLPLPVRQYPVVTPFGPRYLDLAYPELRIAIEIDGMASRLDEAVFLDERARQNLIEAQGWTFRRFGYTHVTQQQIWAIFTLGEALGLRPVRWCRA